MLFRLAAALFAVCVLLPILSSAESTDCTTPVLIIADGRVTQSSFPQNATYWYGIYAQANHSYSVEFIPAADNFQNAYRPQFSSIIIFGPTDYLQGCRGVSTVSVTQNSGYSPVVRTSVGINGSTTANGAGRRVSFVAQNAGLYLISATNVMGAGAYSFRAVDTTLVNVRWNTSPGNDIWWILLNVSDMPITGTLTVFDNNGRVITASQFNIAAGGRITRSSGTSDVNLPRNTAGWAIFSHNGPPSSISGEAFMVNATTTVYEKFDPIDLR